MASEQSAPSTEDKKGLTYEIPAELQSQLSAPALERLKAVLELQVGSRGCAYARCCRSLLSLAVLTAGLCVRRKSTMRSTAR